MLPNRPTASTRTAAVLRLPLPTRERERIDLLDFARAPINDVDLPT